MELHAIIDRLNEDAVLNTMETAELETIVEALVEHEKQFEAQMVLLTRLERYVRDYRQARALPLMDGHIYTLANNIEDLLTVMNARHREATEDAAGLRGMVKNARDWARQAEDNPDEAERLCGQIDYHASEALKEYRSGEARRKEWLGLEIMLERRLADLQQDGGWRYASYVEVEEKVNHIIEYYVRMASLGVAKSTTFKNGVIAWLRGIAINAEAVSWAHTHHEKDARLRGLIEVIETAISKIDELRMEDHYSGWSAAVDAWMKSDFPTREMKRTIQRQELEIKHLRKQLDGQGD